MLDIQGIEKHLLGLHKGVLELIQHLDPMMVLQENVQITIQDLDHGM